MEMWKQEEGVEVKIALRMNTTVSLNMTKDNPYSTANLNMNTLHNQDSGKFWVWENTLIKVQFIKIETVLKYYKTNSNICLLSMGLERNHKKQVNGIWKESVKKDLWFYKRKRRYMENQNKWWINKT